MKTFPLEIVTRDEAFPLRDVVSVDVPAALGRLTVLAGHQPLVCMLTEGGMFVGTPDGEKERWQITGGTMTVDRLQVTVLAHGAVREEREEREEREVG